MAIVAPNALHSRDVRGWLYYIINGKAPPDWVPDVTTTPIDLSRGEEEVAAMGGDASFNELTLPRTTTDFSPLLTKISAIEYDLGVKIREKDMRRDQTNLIKSKIRLQVGTPYQRRWRKILTKTIETTSVSTATKDLAPDGYPFFYATHKIGQSGTQSNLFTKTVGSTTAITDTEAADLVWNAITKMQTLKDDRGEPLDPPTDFLVMAHPTHARAMRRAINAQLVVQGSVVTENDLREQVSEFNLSLALNPYLTSATGIYVFVRDGMSYLTGVEYDAKQESKAEGSEFAIDNLAHAHYIRFSYGTQPYRWESASKTTIST